MSLELAFTISLSVFALTVFSFLWVTFLVAKVRLRAQQNPPKIRPGTTVAQVMKEADEFERNKWKVVKGAPFIILATFALTIFK